MQGRGPELSSLLFLRESRQHAGSKAESRSEEMAVRGLVSLVGLLLLLAGVMACGEQSADDTQEERTMQEKTIETVLKEHTGSLMSLPGVVGTAQGECAGKPCIKVFVVKKTADLLKQIPAAIEGYAVEVQETGEIRALDPS